MNALVSEMNRLIAMPASDPSSSAEIYAIWALAVVCHTIGIIFTGKSVKSSIAYSVPKSVIISAIHLGSILLAITASNLYLVPLLGGSILRGLAPALMLLAAIAGTAAVSCRLIHRTKFSKAIVTMLVALICAVGVAYITRSAFVGARRGAASARQMKDRTEKAGEIPR